MICNFYYLINWKQYLFICPRLFYGQLCATYENSSAQFRQAEEIRVKQPQLSGSNLIYYYVSHGLRTPGEEIAFTARPKINSHSQILRYGRNIFCLPHRPKFSDFFDLCLHWVSVVRDVSYHRRRTCEGFLPNSLRPMSYLGFIWDLYVLGLKSKFFVKKANQILKTMDKGLTVPRWVL